MKSLLIAFLCLLSLATAIDLGKIAAGEESINVRLNERRQAIQMESHIVDLAFGSIYRVKDWDNVAMKISAFSKEEEEDSREYQSFSPYRYEIKTHRIADTLLYRKTHHGHGLYLFTIEPDSQTLEWHILHGNVDSNMLLTALKDEMNNMHDIGIAGFGFHPKSILYSKEMNSVQFLDFEKIRLYSKHSEEDFTFGLKHDLAALNILSSQLKKPLSVQSNEPPIHIRQDYRLLLNWVKLNGIYANGIMYTIGKKLGAGVDGVVFDTNEDSGIALKIFREYRHTKDPQKPKVIPNPDRELPGLTATKRLIRYWKYGPLGIFVFKKSPGHRLKYLAQQKIIDLESTEIQKRVLKAAHDAISQVHEVNVAHGDVHTGNILFTVLPHGELKGYLIDFSRSKMTDAMNWKERKAAFRKDHEKFNEKFKNLLQELYKEGIIKHLRIVNKYFIVPEDV